MTNSQIAQLGDADSENSERPILWNEVTESWQAELGGTDAESVAPNG